MKLSKTKILQNLQGHYSKGLTGKRRIWYLYNHYNFTLIKECFFLIVTKQRIINVARIVYPHYPW